VDDVDDILFLTTSAVFHGFCNYWARVTKEQNMVKGVKTGVTRVLRVLEM
jgi:hypothetical protein